MQSFRKQNFDANTNSDNSGYFITLTSLVTILLTFFIYFNALTIDDSPKQEHNIIASVKSAFKGLQPDKNPALNSQEFTTSKVLDIEFLIKDLPIKQTLNYYLANKNTAVIKIDDQEVFQNRDHQIKSSILALLDTLADRAGAQSLGIDIAVSSINSGHSQSTKISTLETLTKKAQTLQRFFESSRFSIPLLHSSGNLDSSKGEGENNTYVELKFFIPKE